MTIIKEQAKMVENDKKNRLITINFFKPQKMA